MTAFRIELHGRSRALPERSPLFGWITEGEKEGAHGGNLGSPVLKMPGIPPELLEQAQQQQGRR